MPNRFRLVLDTNSLLRGLANRDSASGRVLGLCERRQVTLLLSRPVLSEYRRVLGSPEIVRRNPDIAAADLELVLRRLRYFSLNIGPVGARFRFDRDPMDEKIIELPIAGSASHIVTNDKDLLSLMSGHDDAARRFRQRLSNVCVLIPADFLKQFEASASGA
ncbi:MAG: putative toxin-antitoxin system toxin component, PIN family [Tepidisphaerales bacterium]